MALWMPWHYISIAALLPTILLTVSMIFMPESPNWLMIKFGRGTQVVEALQRLRRDDSDIDKELDELEERANISKQGSGFSIRQIGRKDVYKPLLIGMCLVFFQQFCGMNAVQFYMTDMFRESGSKLEPLYDMLITNAAMLVATVFGGLLIDRLGRKILLYISGFGHMSSIAVLGYHYFKNREVDSAHTEPSIVPILCLIVFVSSFSIGYGPIPWIIVTEITSSSAIGFIITTTSVFAWIFTFLVTKEFVDISKIAGKYGALWMFSCISALSIAFAFYLPETKGKSVEEIQKLLYPEVTNSNNQNNNKVVTNL
jgi:MFS family permease